MRTSNDDPLMADFVAHLDDVNATADAAPGFVWRFIEHDDGAEVTSVFNRGDVLFNMSVWESVEALEAWTYSGRHLDVVRKRSKWFRSSDRSPYVLWWIGIGHTPTVAEARDRLERLWKGGSTPEAFTFGRRYPPL